jgi:IS1 family transposase
MNRLSPEARTAVLSALIEGCSIRSTVRMTGVAKKTVMRLLIEAGAVCDRYQNRVMRNLSCQRIQVDELWSFCYAKSRNVTAKIAKEHPMAGDVWLWTALDADTKLVPAWCIGHRDAEAAEAFIRDLANRLSNRVQLTSDGHRAYLGAVESVFGTEIDYSQLIKLYARDREPEVRYSPPKCIGCRREPVTGNPDPKHISTSYVERQNLTARMSMRRFTRLTNAFSKKIESHAAAIALYFFSYNFIKIHRTLRVTPAMAAGVTDRLWEVSDLAALMEAEDWGAKKAA